MFFLGCVRWVLEGQRNWGLFVCEGDGLQRGAQLPRNIQQWVGTFLQQGKTKRGKRTWNKDIHKISTILNCCQCQFISILHNNNLHYICKQAKIDWYFRTSIKLRRLDHHYLCVPKNNGLAIGFELDFWDNYQH